jgi:murein L,D-transpeptidase YcbB/YkuD
MVFTFLPFCALAVDESASEKRQLCDLSVLENAVTHYQQISDQGGWPQIPSGPALREGDRNDRIPLLKKRLIASGDLQPAEPPEQPDAANGISRETASGSQSRLANPDSQNGNLSPAKKHSNKNNGLNETTDRNTVFDESLKEAVQKFQARHGLTANGVVGTETLKELNVTASERAKQLASTIERCKKMPPAQGNRYILINITDFTLNLIEDGKPVLNMPVIVGKTTQQTPEFDGLITNVIINPAWSVPYSIASKEYLPKLKKNPGYLSRSRMRVYRANQRIDPSTINWSSYSTNNFPLLLRQDPGPGNSLGRIKFMFTNPHDIYLHDTTTKKLFQRFPRAFSHGCIRVKNPVDLAVYLMQETPMGSEEAIKSAINKGATRSLNLPSPIPINIVYVTAWVDSEGIVQFRPNIYNRKLAGSGEVIAKNNSAAKTTDASMTDQKKEAAEFSETQPPKVAIVKTTAPAKTLPVAAVPVQSKALIKTTEPAATGIQTVSPAKVTLAAPPVAQAKPVTQAPAAAKPAVQVIPPVKASAAAPAQTQTKAATKTPVVTQSTLQPVAPPAAQAKPVTQTQTAAKSAVQATTPAKTPAAAPPAVQAKPVTQTTPTTQPAAAVKTSPVPPAQKVKVIGNRDSKRYHLPGMKYYNAVEAYHRVEFDSEADAIKAGYYKARR